MVARVKISSCLPSCVMTLLAVLLFCFCVVNVESKNNTCFVETSVRLNIGAKENSTCGYVQGRVQICENGLWKNLCDTNWTISDAQVTCRSLNYSTIGAENITIAQGASGSSDKGVQCSGTENNLTECTITNNNNDCGFAILVLCYTSDLNANKKCEDINPATTILKPSTITSIASTSTTNPLTSDHMPPNMSETTMDSSSEPSSASRGALEPPTLYYVIGGIAAVLLTGILILALMILLCCRWTRRKDISPIRTEEGNGNEKENTLNKDRSGDMEEHNDLTATHHRLQQSGPIYEAIQNESSSTHSQGSPNLKPLHNPDELYSMLDTNELYAQIEPHISQSTAATAVDTPPPVPDSNYQLLNHNKGSSLKRGVPGVPSQFQAVNKMAVEGVLMEDERPSHQPLSSNMATKTRSSPKTSESLEQTHSGQVHASQFDEGGGSNEENDQNFYHILEPPVNYSPFGGNVSEVSTTAVCNNEIRRSSPKSIREGNSPQINSRYQKLTASLSSNTSEHSRSPASVHSGGGPPSRANSLSGGSPSTNRANGSLSMTRIDGEKKAMNRYTESPVPSRKQSNSNSNSNSPQVHRPGKGSSRLSDQSENIDVQSDHSDMNTLV